MLSLLPVYEVDGVPEWVAASACVVCRLHFMLLASSFMQALPGTNIRSLCCDSSAICSYCILIAALVTCMAMHIMASCWVVGVHGTVVTDGLLFAYRAALEQS